MDRNTVIGGLAGIALLLYGMASGGKLPYFFHVPSLILTVGGGLVSTILTVSPETLEQAMRVLPKLLFDRKPDASATLHQLVTLSQKARREGLLALEADAGMAADSFAIRALTLVVDGVEAERIRKAMSLELDNVRFRHQTCISLFKSMGGYFPAWGMIGTLLGLITLLRSLDDPSMIGGSMSVAMITTFYGSVMANFFALPIAGRLNEKSREEIRLKEMVMEGILGIQEGVNPHILEHELQTFLSPAQRLQHQAATDPPLQTEEASGDRVLTRMTEQTGRR